jgi:hypothetical protein
MEFSEGPFRKQKVTQSSKTYDSRDTARVVPDALFAPPRLPSTLVALSTYQAPVTF